MPLRPDLSPRERRRREVLWDYGDRYWEQHERALASLPVAGALFAGSQLHEPAPSPHSSPPEVEGVEASSAAAPAPAPASAKTTLPPTTVRTVVCPTKAGVIFTDATESDAAVQELESSRFLMKEERMLPYRTKDGHISLPLLESSMALVTSGALTPPKQVVSSLHKWLQYARNALAADKVGGRAASAAAPSKKFIPVSAHLPSPLPCLASPSPSPLC